MMNKLNRTDRTILVIAGSLLVIFSYFLYDDSLLFRRLDNNHNEQIGRIYGLQNDVRRKSQGTFSWLPTSNLEAVSHMDSVFTGAGSEASIQLFDGSLIHIRENSLITLNVIQGQLKLELKYGDLVGEINKNSEIKIKSGNEEYQLKGDSQESSVVISHDRVGKSDVQTLKGAPQVTSTKTGKKMSLKTATAEKAQQLRKVAAPVLEIPKSEVSVQLLTKDKAVFSRLKTEDPISFDWKAKGEVQEFSIEIRKSESDATLAFQDNTKKDHLTLASGLPEGEYVWHVRALDSNRKLLAKSEYRKFKVMYLIPPYVTKPTLGEAVAGEAAFVSLEWSSQLALQYEWQLATDNSFQKPISLGATKNLAVEIPNPHAGSYWLRIRAQKDEKIWTAWSEPGKFTVAAPKLAAISPPLLLQKKFEVHPKPAAGREPASVPVTKINWKQVPTATTYIVEVGEDANFQVAQKYETQDLAYALDKYSKKVQFVRVKAKNKSGQTSIASDTAQINLSIDKPVLNKQDSIVEKSYETGAQPKGQEIPISWSSVFLAGQYKLELSKDPEFSAPQVLEVPSNSSKVKVTQPGKYYARVRPINKNGQTLTEYSNTIEFEYSFRSSLPPPTLNEPFNKSTVFLQKDVEPFVWLEWKVTPTVLRYEIQVAQDPEFKKILISTKSEKNRFLLKQKLPYGKVFWRVRAIAEDAKQSSDWSESRFFSLTYKKNENFVE